MSVKRTFLLIVFFLLVLSPVGQVLRTQTPWTCFHFTYDETYFAQAIDNWIQGRGFRIHGGTPFHPLITIGIPVAWGTAAISHIFGVETAFAGRLFVHLSFYVLLFVAAILAYWRTKSWVAPALTMSLLVMGFSSTPSGPYLIMGLLGEVPAILVGLLATYCLDRRKFVFAGVLAVACFIIKPTFIFLIPAILIASAFISARGAWILLTTIGVTLVAYWFTIAGIRDQEVGEFLIETYRVSSEVAKNNPGKNFFAYYDLAGRNSAILTGLFVITGALGFMTRAGRKLASRNTAFLFLVIGILFYVIGEKQPIEKQWTGILCLASAIFALHWGTVWSEKIQILFPRDSVRLAFFMAIAVWILNVPTPARRAFVRTPENACPAKEQRYIGRMLSTAHKEGRLKDTTDLGVLIDSPSFQLFIYELPWNPRYLHHSRDLETPLPRWIVGEKSKLIPLLSDSGRRCKADWMGLEFGILRCEPR